MRTGSSRFQIHLSTCVLLMFLAGALMSVYFQYSKFLLSLEFVAENGSVHGAMLTSFISFSLSILIGAAFIFERVIAGPTPATATLRAVRR